MTPCQDEPKLTPYMRRKRKLVDLEYAELDVTLSQRSLERSLKKRDEVLEEIRQLDEEIDKKKKK